MKCSDCGKPAMARVTVNGQVTLVCGACHAAIVQRIEQIARRFGHVPRLQDIAVMAIESVAVEDLPAS